jgi:hypothetical protein
MNNVEPVKKENGLLALIIGKPIEMLIGALLTVITVLTSLIYHDGHEAMTSIVSRVDKMEIRVRDTENSLIHANDDIADLQRLEQYGLAPKPLKRETK